MKDHNSTANENVILLSTYSQEYAYGMFLDRGIHCMYIYIFLYINAIMRAGMSSLMKEHAAQLKD